MTFANANQAVQKPSAGADTEVESVAPDLDDLKLEVPAEFKFPKIGKGGQ